MSFSVVMWPWFWKWKTLALPIWGLELITTKIKQNYLKQRDLAPLNKSGSGKIIPLSASALNQASSHWIGLFLDHPGEARDA